MKPTPTTFSLNPMEISIASVFKLIDTTARRLREIERLTVKDTGLTPAQYYVLGILWKSDALPLAEIADRAHCSRATITGIIDTLEKKEMVERIQNPHDRRSILARLTETGAGLQGAMSNGENHLKCCCDGLTPHEYFMLSQLLTKLHRSLGRDSSCTTSDKG